MERGQQAIADLNHAHLVDFEARFEATITAQEAEPTATTVLEFCKICGCSKPRHADKLARVLALPSMRGRGNPNAWYVKPLPPTN